MRRKIVWTVTVLVVALSGCSLNPWSADYDCRGYPKGVTCKSAREVYELTNYRDSLETKDEPQQYGQYDQYGQVGQDRNCPECGKE